MVFGGKKEVEEFLGNVTLTVVPFLAGYRHNFSGFYLEPQAGYGSYRTKVHSLGSDSEAAFTWAMGLGFAKKRLDVGARFQSGVTDGSTANLVALRIGYNFSLKGAKKE